MSEREAKKETTAVAGTSSSSAQDSSELPAPIKNVNIFQSLENCQKFVERETHQARITKLRKEGLEFLQNTNWMYSHHGST